MISITGAPYDTLQTVIGFGETSSRSSLKSYGVKYEQIELINNEFDEKAILERLKQQDVKLIEIQRSRGYSTRKSLRIEKIEKQLLRQLGKLNKQVIIMVDNCYGEFVQEKRTNRNRSRYSSRFINEKLGAGIATSGAYIVGKKKDLVELCAERLTAPGIGKEIGPSLGQNMNLKRTILCPTSCNKQCKNSSICK